MSVTVLPLQKKPDRTAMILQAVIAMMQNAGEQQSRTADREARKGEFDARLAMDQEKLDMTVQEKAEAKALSELLAQRMGQEGQLKPGPWAEPTNWGPVDTEQVLTQLDAGAGYGAHRNRLATEAQAAEKSAQLERDREARRASNDAAIAYANKNGWDLGVLNGMDPEAVYTTDLWPLLTLEAEKAGDQEKFGQAQKLANARFAHDTSERKAAERFAIEQAANNKTPGGPQGLDADDWVNLAERRDVLVKQLAGANGTPLPAGPERDRVEAELAQLDARLEYIQSHPDGPEGGDDDEAPVKRRPFLTWLGDTMESAAGDDSSGVTDVAIDSANELLGHDPSEAAMAISLEATRRAKEAILKDEPEPGATGNFNSVLLDNESFNNARPDGWWAKDPRWKAEYEKYFRIVAKENSAQAGT